MQSQFATLPRPLRVVAEHAYEGLQLREELALRGVDPRSINYTVSLKEFAQKYYVIALGEYRDLLPREKRSPSWLLSQPKEFQKQFWSVALLRGDREAAAYLGAKPCAEEAVMPPIVRPPAQQIDLPVPVCHDEVVAIDAFTGRFTLPSLDQGKAVMTPHMNRWKVLGVLRDEHGEILHMAPTTDCIRCSIGRPSDMAIRSNALTLSGKLNFQRHPRTKKEKNNYGSSNRSRNAYGRNARSPSRSNPAITGEVQ